MNGLRVVFLGIIDKATHYHVHDLLPDALPETTFASETSCWFSPFGLPLVIITDQDPRFLGSCLQKEEELGIKVKFVPEAAHYDHIWRSMLEKTIDALQIMDVDKLQIAAVACDDSFNSLNNGVEGPLNRRSLAG